MDGIKTYVREFGKIERIIDTFFFNGQLQSTRFKMRRYSTENSQWTDEHKYLDFYGEIPKEFVGQEVMYFQGKETEGKVGDLITHLKIGKITPRGNGAYDVLESEHPDLTVPTMITGRYR